MRIPILNRAQPVEGFDVAHELAIKPDRVEAVGAAHSNGIYNLTHNPFLKGGLQAATHRVVFGDDGFGHYSDIEATRDALQKSASVGNWPPEKAMPGWAADLHLPSLAALAILFGEQPSEHQEAVLKQPLQGTADWRMEGASFRLPRKNYFEWAYATDPFASARVVFGQEAFEDVLSQTARSKNSTVEALQAGLSANTRKYLQHLRKEKEADPKRTLHWLANLRILEAAEIQIVPGEGIKIIDVAVVEPQEETEVQDAAASDQLTAQAAAA